MSIALKDLIDIPRLQALLDTLHEIHSLPSAIIDTEGNILTATAWQEICTKFHRAHPETERTCKSSDSFIARELGKHPANVVYTCPLGLVDAATPIIVEGRHIGSVFTGQLFTGPPDEARFIRQAREYGFDEDAYLAALRKVPVFSEERLQKNMKFLGRFTEMLAEQGLRHKRQIETETALRESEARFRGLAEALPDLLFATDADGSLTYASPSISSILGWSQEEAMGRNFVEFLPPEEIPRTMEVFRSAIEQGVPARGVMLSIKRKDGRLFSGELNGQRTQTNRGTAGTIGLIRDITDRKLAEMQIRDLNANLEQRVAERTQELETLVYIIAHDLRAPLRAVDGFSGILEEEYGVRLDEEGRRLLKVVRSGAQGMDRLINGLLEFSRIGSAAIHRGPVDMRAMAAATYEEIATDEVRRTFRFAVGELPHIEGDAVLLRHVWRNLLGNAIKFTLSSAERSIEVGGESKDGMATYWVRDSGVGFNQAYAHRLFGVFQRLHAAEAFEGVGIGLAIVQRIVTRHGGRVWTEGAVNAGATFFFSLPEGGGADG